MNVADFAVIAGGVVMIGLLAWFFFGPKKARQAEMVGGVQEVRVTVKGVWGSTITSYSTLSEQ